MPIQKLIIFLMSQKINFLVLLFSNLYLFYQLILYPWSRVVLKQLTSSYKTSLVVITIAQINLEHC